MAPGNRKAPKRSVASESQYSLVEFMRDFPDDETCLTWLWNTRYNLGDDTAHCARCGEVRTFRRYTAKQQRQDWTCTACGLHVHPTAGTIFHKSSTSLHLWFYAMYLMTSTRCGISAKQLERELGVTYKTAWRMFTLIRNELMTQDDDEPLSGEVEMDEMYVGGKPRQSDRASWAGLPPSQSAARPLKTWSRPRSRSPVFGMVERERPDVAAHVVPSRQQATRSWPTSTDAVDPTAIVYTDDATHVPPAPQTGTSTTRSTTRPRLRERGRPHEHHRRLLVAGEARHLGDSSRGVPQVAAGVPERVRLAVQPPRRRPCRCSPYSSSGRPSRVR